MTGISETWEVRMKWRHFYNYWTLTMCQHIINILRVLHIFSHLLLVMTYLWSRCESESESHSVVSYSLRPMDYTVHGILQARKLDWVAFPFSEGSSQPRDWIQVSHIADRFFTSWATREMLLNQPTQNVVAECNHWLLFISQLGSSDVGQDWLVLAGLAHVSAFSLWVSCWLV